MWLFPHEAAVLKHLNDLLKTDLPRVRGDPRIMKPLIKWSGSEKKVVDALVFGQGPRVKVKPIDTIPLRFPMNAAKTFGHTPNHSKQTGLIELERALVRFLEAPLPPKHTPTPKEPVASALQQLRTFIRNVLLHELVHFVNNELEREERDAKGNPIEAGEEFDRDARLLKDPLPPFFIVDPENRTGV